MDTIRDSLIQLALDNWQLIALAVVGVSALGTLLGSLKKLAGALFTASLKAGETGASAVMTKKGLRVAVPLALASTLFGSGWLLGASKPPKIEYVASPPEIVTRNVVKEVVREVKVPTFIEKIVEVPAKIFTPAANAKCYWCAALLNIDGVPLQKEYSQDTLFRCGACYGSLMVGHARKHYMFERDKPPWSGSMLKDDNPDRYICKAVGRDPIPKPEPPPPDASEADRKKHKNAVDVWEDQCRRFVER